MKYEQAEVILSPQVIRDARASIARMLEISERAGLRYDDRENNKSVFFTAKFAILRVWSIFGK